MPYLVKKKLKGNFIDLVETAPKIVSSRVLIFGRHDLVAWVFAAIYFKCLFRCVDRSDGLCYDEYYKYGNCHLRAKCCVEIITVMTRYIKRGIQ